MARGDLPPVELPLQHSPREVATLREETTSSSLSFEAEIDQFRFEEEREAPERLVELLDSEVELDTSSTANSPRLVITQVDSSFEEEEDMALNPRRGLKDLVVMRNKRSSYKEVPKSQATDNLPPPPSSPITSLGLIPLPNLRKKRKE